jgi:hypothetical protein
MSTRASNAGVHESWGHSCAELVCGGSSSGFESNRHRPAGTYGSKPTRFTGGPTRFARRSSSARSGLGSKHDGEVVPPQPGHRISPLSLVPRTGAGCGRRVIRCFGPSGEDGVSRRFSRAGESRRSSGWFFPRVHRFAGSKALQLLERRLGRADLRRLPHRSTEASRSADPNRRWARAS